MIDQHVQGLPDHHESGFLQQRSDQPAGLDQRVHLLFLADAWPRRTGQRQDAFRPDRLGLRDGQLLTASTNRGWFSGSFGPQSLMVPMPPPTAPQATPNSSQRRRTASLSSHPPQPSVSKAEKPAAAICSICSTWDPLNHCGATAILVRKPVALAVSAASAAVTLRAILAAAVAVAAPIPVIKKARRSIEFSPWQVEHGGNSNNRPSIIPQGPPAVTWQREVVQPPFLATLAIRVRIANNLGIPPSFARPPVTGNPA